MWPPVNGCLSPLTITTTEDPLNVRTAPGNTVQTLSCRARDERALRRSMRRGGRSEPLYRRTDVRHQHRPYLTSANQRHNKQAQDQSSEQLTLDSNLTNDDIQAATILMLFAKKHLSMCDDKTRTNSTTTVCVANKHDNIPTKDYAIPHVLLLRIVKSLRFPYLGGRSRQRWKKDCSVKFMVSCMMVRPIVPSMPMPLLLQRAIHVAEQLVTHARHKKMPDEQDICCLDCGMLPVRPVTGQCGHTRCLECIRNSCTCTCGTPAPQELFVDTCVQYLIGKLLANKQSSSVALKTTKQPPVTEQPLHVCAIRGRVLQEDCHARRTVAQRLSRGLRVSLTISPDSFSAPEVPARLPMTPQARLLHACDLIRGQCDLEAAAHLARAATYKDFQIARRLLVQTVAILLEDRDPDLVARDVSGYVNQQAAESWLKPSDLECVLCRDTLVSPVTTPCGHTYCRRCIEYSMDYRRTCPMCVRDLTDFNLALTQKTHFVCAALASINKQHHSPPPLDPSVIPVFVCEFACAFPTVPCPLMILEPRYRVYIRQIVESGTRRLGMAARNEDHTDSDYGTMLEVRDCVECRDGRIIVSTIGISRFKIVERIMDGGCLARVEMLTDKIPRDPVSIRLLRMIGSEVVIKGCLWIKNLEYSVRSKIEREFGKMPFSDDEWWVNPDGPDWLWWLIASLPLAPELKGMMISSSRLMTRLHAMRRSLQLVLDAADFIREDAN